MLAAKPPVKEPMRNAMKSGRPKRGVDGVYRALAPSRNRPCERVLGQHEDASPPTGARRDRFDAPCMWLATARHVAPEGRSSASSAGEADDVAKSSPRSSGRWSRPAVWCPVHRLVARELARSTRRSLAGSPQWSMKSPTPPAPIGQGIEAAIDRGACEPPGAAGRAVDPPVPKSAPLSSPLPARRRRR